MDGNLPVGTLNVLIALFGVLFVALMVYEYLKLRDFKDEMRRSLADLRDDIHKTQKASQRITASYGIKDPAQRISLLESAVRIAPAAFNGFNALGYAYLDNGDFQKAVDAFKEATHYRPKDKEGYCDLAVAYLGNGDFDLCIKYLKKAITVDESTKDDLRGNPVFASVSDRAEFQALFSYRPGPDEAATL